MIPRDQVVLITGATGGIGFEIAAQAAEDGMVVGVHGSSASSVGAAMDRLTARVPEGRFVAAPADYNGRVEVVGMVDRLVAVSGRLDAVVDCAIVFGTKSYAGPFAEIDPAAFGQPGSAAGELQLICHAAIPHLEKTGGAIVAFASDSGRFAAPRQSGVAAKQAAIIGFVRSLATEIARQGVRINCISPSFVEGTPIFERFSRLGARAERSRQRAGLGLPTPKDIAPLALFLCCPGSAKITGQVISVNGGLNA